MKIKSLLVFFVMLCGIVFLSGCVSPASSQRVSPVQDSAMLLKTVAPVQSAGVNVMNGFTNVSLKVVSSANPTQSKMIEPMEMCTFPFVGGQMIALFFQVIKGDDVVGYFGVEFTPKSSRSANGTTRYHSENFIVDDPKLIKTGKAAP